MDKGMGTKNKVQMLEQASQLPNHYCPAQMEAGQPLILGRGLRSFENGRGASGTTMGIWRGQGNKLGTTHGPW